MRRLVIALALIALPSLALGQQTVVTRVAGTVTAQNYPALAAFLQERFDQVVALSLTVPASETYAEGALWAGMEGDLFVAYVAGPGGDSQISASNGFVEAGGGFVFDRAYKVVYGGMGQGITAILLEPTLPPPGVPVKSVGIDDLPLLGGGG